MELDDLSKKQKKRLGILGITVVLGSWVLIPLIGKIYFDFSSLETGFWLTMFWSIVWLINKYRKRRIKKS